MMPNAALERRRNAKRSAAPDWYQKAINTLQLNGLGERTQEAYVRALRMLCEFYDKTPDQISEHELQQYFLQRRNVDGWSASTMRICYCGIRHFFIHVLHRDWHTLSLIRAQSERKLPAILSREEVSARLGCVRTPHNRTFLTTVYTLGLRAQHLEVSDIDSQRMMVHGMRIEDFPAFARLHWPQIRQQLVDGTYRPQPVRRVSIAMPGGGERGLMLQFGA